MLEFRALVNCGQAFSEGFANQNMLEALVELQRLKRLDRTGWTLRGLPTGTESVAAHSFGVSVAAMFLVDELAARGIAVDSERVLRMALLHDWAETRTGDMPRTATDYFGVPARRRAETTAFSDVVKGTRIATLYSELYEDYESRGNLEARLVKAADVIDLLVQALALERAGARGLDEFWDVVQDADFQLEGEAEKIVGSILKDLVNMRKTPG